VIIAFDAALGRFGPGLCATVAGIEEAFRLGEDRVDLGHGEYGYKLQLATDLRQICWQEIFVRDARYPLVRAHALPRHARQRYIEARKDLRLGTRLAGARSRIAGKLPNSSRR
jgi:CelD/BcsL family acetyltransferase involved in cellulose biosynthesis